jgi:hypothetical protein
MFAYYTAEGIWSTGESAEDAIETFLREAQAEPEEIGQMDTAPMTERLAAYIEAHGFDCQRDSYSWTGDMLALDLNA